ncbi:MAG: hypothetical protein ACK4SR_03425 [Thiobacillus sp.]
MSVLKKTQFADAAERGVADAAIIGVDALECQKPPSDAKAARNRPCSTVAP